jgi:Poxvirus A22 protein
MTRILAFDVGIKNLSFCLIDSSLSGTEVLQWKNVSIVETDNCNKMGVDELTEGMLVTLQEHFDQNFAADVVLIENQPMHMNGLMKTLSVVIYTYFNMLKIQFGSVSQVKFISATNKLKCKKGTGSPATKTYKDRKRCGRELARLYVKDSFEEWTGFFSAAHKEDDLADALLFCVYYAEHVLGHDVKSRCSS